MGFAFRLFSRYIFHITKFSGQKFCHYPLSKTNDRSTPLEYNEQNTDIDW